MRPNPLTPHTQIHSDFSTVTQTRTRTRTRTPHSGDATPLYTHLCRQPRITMICDPCQPNFFSFNRLGRFGNLVPARSFVPALAFKAPQPQAVPQHATPWRSSWIGTHLAHSDFLCRALEILTVSTYHLSKGVYLTLRHDTARHTTHPSNPHQNTTLCIHTFCCVAWVFYIYITLPHNPSQVSHSAQAV